METSVRGTGVRSFCSSSPWELSTSLVRCLVSYQRALSPQGLRTEEEEEWGREWRRGEDVDFCLMAETCQGRFSGLPRIVEKRLCPRLL